MPLNFHIHPQGYNFLPSILDLEAFLMIRENYAIENPYNGSTNSKPINMIGSVNSNLEVLLLQEKTKNPLGMKMAEILYEEVIMNLENDEETIIGESSNDKVLRVYQDLQRWFNVEKITLKKRKGIYQPLKKDLEKLNKFSHTVWRKKGYEGV